MPEKSTELVEDLILEPATNGRRTYSVAAKRALVQSCLRPGVSVASTALANGINANLLRRWMVLYGPAGRPANDASTGVSLVPVSTGSAATLRVSSSPDSSIEIIFMGTTLRVRGMVDARALRAVLDCLAQRA